MKHSISSSANHDPQHAGFTLLELVVVVGIIAVLGLMLVPAFASTKGDGRVQRCMNNQKQLMQAWLMYTTDNADRFPLIGSWAGGIMDWTSSPDNTNTAILEDPSQSTIAAYVKAAALFKCPADIYQSTANPGPRARSISANGVLGGKPTVQGTYPNGTIYYGGLSTIATSIMNLIKPGPSRVFTILDEHPDSINDAAFMLDPGYSPGSERWRNLPGSFHDGAGSLSFADGHFELHKWLEVTGIKTTLYPVTETSSTPWTSVVLGASRDYEWMDSKMPYK